MQQATVIKTCKEMGGATSVVPVIQRRVQSVGWYHRLDGTLWLAPSCKCCNLQLASCKF